LPDSGEETIKAEHVRVVTGATRSETVLELVRAALNNDLDSGLQQINEVVYGGRDLTLFMRDLTLAFSRLLLPAEKTQLSGTDCLAGDKDLPGKGEQPVERHLLLDAVELLYQTASELRNAHFPQYLLEIFFIRLLRVLHGKLKPAPGLYLDEVVSGQREKTAAAAPAVAAGPVGKRSEEQPASEEVTVKGDKVEGDKQPSAEPPLQNGERLAGLLEAWPDLLEEIKKRQKTTAAWLEPAAVIDCRGHLVKLAYAPEYDIHRLRIMEESHRKLVETVLSRFFQIKMELKAIIVEDEELFAAKKAVSSEGTTTRSEAETVADQSNSQFKEKESSEPAPVEKKTIRVEDAQRVLGGKIIDHH